MDIEVYRYTGDSPGEDIIEPLLATIPPALARGKAELDERARPRTRIDLGSRYQPNSLPGKLCRVSDSWQGQDWRGKIISVSHELSIENGVAVVTTRHGIKRHE